MGRFIGSNMAQNETVDIFGLPIRNVALAEASALLVNAASAHLRQQVFFLNAHCANVAVSNKAYVEALRAADLRFADGSGMRIAAKLTGVTLRDNVNGTDLFPLLCRDAAIKGVGIGLLGARPDVAHRCAETMASRFPGLQVAFTHHGYFSEADTPSIIRSINASGAGLLFVALGVPSQELWIARHAAELQVPVILGVGALFDFYSGTVRRAPLAVRKLGMEWAYRFLLEPRRLFARYVLGNPLFLWRVAVRRIRGRDALRHDPLIDE
jgi:N-acetylglucosaminyldiphosphoundecaprenol N-acetyl-beta-D-mannosaminyltransferase